MHQQLFVRDIAIVAPDEYLVVEFFEQFDNVIASLRPFIAGEVLRHGKVAVRGNDIGHNRVHCDSEQAFIVIEMLIRSLQYVKHSSGQAMPGNLTRAWRDSIFCGIANLAITGNAATGTLAIIILASAKHRVQILPKTRMPWHAWISLQPIMYALSCVAQRGGDILHPEVAFKNISDRFPLGVGKQILLEKTVPEPVAHRRSKQRFHSSVWPLLDEILIMEVIVLAHCSPHSRRQSHRYLHLLFPALARSP